MKKVVFTILIFLTFLMADATVLQKVYHKDYGVIDRTVLVFNRKIDFKVEHRDNVVEILLPNCSKDESRVSNELFTTSNVLKSFSYRQRGNNLHFIILLNDGYTTVNNSDFSVEYLSYQQDVYKIALDIFATQNPTSHEELLSFVNFYTTLGQKEKAKIFKEKLTQKIENDKRIAAEKLALEKNTKINKPASDPTSNPQAADSNVEDSIVKIKMILIPILIVIIIGLVIWLVIHIIRQGKKVEENLPQEIQPVGREEFRTRVIRKLLDHDWNKRVISLELKVPLSEVEEVEKKYQLERSQQLENEEPTDQIEKETDKPGLDSIPEKNNEDCVTEKNDPEEKANKTEIVTEENPVISVENELKNTPEETPIPKPDSKINRDTLDIIENSLKPEEVTRDSDEIDNPEIDESLKEMLEYDSSDKHDKMSSILDKVKFSTEEIDKIREENNTSNEKTSEVENPDEELEKAITNKLDELTKRSPEREIQK